MGSAVVVAAVIGGAIALQVATIGKVDLRHGKTILAVVGQHLPERSGIGARVLGAVAGAGVNIEMISYGMESINFTMLIDDANIGQAVKVLHEMLFTDA